MELSSVPRSERGAWVAGRRNRWGSGIIASLVRFGSMLALARTQVRAERMAGRMTESCRRSELRFRNALEYSAIGTALLDEHGRSADANPALERVSRKSRTQLIGWP